MTARIAILLLLAGWPALAGAPRFDKWQIVGPGGGGGQFSHTISPHDPNIVLAACDSGRSEIARAGGMGGVAGALVDAGANHVVGTRWPVGDRAAEHFSRRFHTHLSSRPDTPVAALQRAVADLREDKSFRHPSHWAGWFLLARGASLDTSGAGIAGRP